jgi:CubicO group peptidase (beta-lactamase class C family)
VNGLLNLQHGGERIGFGSLVRLVPQRRIGIIVLGNRTGASLVRSFETATAIALALPNSCPAAGPAAPATVSAVAGPPMPPIEQLVGRYVNKAGELSLDLALERGKVTARADSGGPTGSVDRLPDGRYVTGGQPFTFVRGRKTKHIYLFIAGRALRRER